MTRADALGMRERAAKVAAVPEYRHPEYKTETATVNRCLAAIDALPLPDESAPGADEKPIGPLHKWEDKRPANRPDGWPTRNDIQWMSRAELAIREAMGAVEDAGGSIALTDAVTLLAMARDRVADHIEGIKLDNSTFPAASLPAPAAGVDVLGLLDQYGLAAIAYDGKQPDRVQGARWQMDDAKAKVVAAIADLQHPKGER